MIDKKTGKKSKKAPKFVKQGDSCIVRIEAAQSICVETYADYPQLGRFTMRDEGIYMNNMLIERKNCSSWKNHKVNFKYRLEFKIFWLAIFLR
jgi:hypothetical protein